jgi:radical SAM superfamily enzyme YgiQ (UPF0313 family)
MLLIFPPVAKACEPPAGIAKLAGALSAHGLPCTILDANLEGLLSLAQLPQTPSDTWTRRAVRNLSAHIAALRAPQTYRSFDRYSRAVRDVNRVLESSAGAYGAISGLADYHHGQLSPVRSADLIAAAERPEGNPFHPYFSKRLREFPDEPLVGFSLNYLSQALCTFAMIGCAKKEFPGAKIVLGGSLVTSWMKRPGWKNPFAGLVDHLVAGPGEEALLELLGAKDVKPAHDMPDYSALPLQDYLAPGLILPYSGSSGCFWHRCSFCPEGAEDNPYVPVPAARAMADLDALIAKTKPVLIHLLDNAISPALMRALAEKPPGVPWYGFARIDGELAGLDYCLALKRSGCVMLKLGLESGDQTVLDRMHKGIDLATASRVLENLRDAGIAAYIYLLFGTPPETAAAAQKTLEFVVRHRDAISFLNLAVFNMPVCGDEAGEYETEPFYEGDLSLYTGFRHPRGWDRKQVRKFLDTEFKRHPAVSAIVRKDPPVFTSNHAPFFAPGGKTAGL